MTDGRSTTIDDQINEWLHVDHHQTHIPLNSTFDPSHPQIREDIIRLIVQYLQSEQYALSATTLQDETNVKIRNELHYHDVIKRMTNSIELGHWDIVIKLATKHLRYPTRQVRWVYMIHIHEIYSYMYS